MKQMATLVVLGWFTYAAAGCQREGPTEQLSNQAEKTTGAIERTLNTPIEKAKAVERILQKSVERTAELSQQAGE
jgi:hypothetical protein